MIENGSWAPNAAKTMTALLEGSKNLSFAGTVTVRGAMTEENMEQLSALADALL